MKITYFGHSAIQIETGGSVILVDPFISGNSWTDGVVTPEDLNPDTILLSHAHGDHWGDTPSIAKRSGAQVVAGFEIIQYLANRHGYENGLPGNTGGRIELDWGSVLFTHARHSSSFPDGTYGGVANGLLIQAGGFTVYHAGDTSPFPDMQRLGERYSIDLALIPIGDCFTMGPQDSLVAIDMIKPGRVIPIHYNTFPPIEVSDEQLDEWKAGIRERGAEPTILGAGEALEL